MEFESFVKQNISKLAKHQKLKNQSHDWFYETTKYNYCYNFNWLGRPIIQYPQDIVGMQEIIWAVKPDLIIETGIAHGGSLVFSASMLALLDMTESITSGEILELKKPRRKVLGIDIDIREHNREKINSHPLLPWITMIEGSSISADVYTQVKKIAKNYKNVLVCLDSNHTHAHVLEELNMYADLTSVGSYCCVFDTIIEDMPEAMSENRPWGPGDNPKTAVFDFLKQNSNFEIDNELEHKLLITVAPSGYLKRVK